MLWTTIFIVIVLWMVGVATSYPVTGGTYTLVAAAVVFLIVRRIVRPSPGAGV